MIVVWRCDSKAGTNLGILKGGGVVRKKRAVGFRQFFSIIFS
jgi:hypothetical protein